MALKLKMEGQAADEDEHRQVMLRLSGSVITSSAGA